MSKPPTLADAILARSYQRDINPAAVKPMRAIVPARKFVLDEALCQYWADMDMALLGRGTHGKKLRLLDMMRLQSRIPHALTWIEHSPRHYREYTFKKHGVVLKPSMRTAMRRGWLIQQHPGVPTAFRCSEYGAHDSMDDLHLSYFDMVWVADDDTPLPWKPAEYPREWLHSSYGVATTNISKAPNLDVDWDNDEDHIWAESEMLGGMGSYVTPQVGLTHGNGISINPKFRYNFQPRELWRMRANARAMWMLLTMINDTPTAIEHVIPNKGYMARGSYKKFLKHSIIHLNVPQTRWRKMIADHVALLRMRAHQVRGHWRRDWRHPGRAQCDHLWHADGNTLECRRCGGVKLWIAEHQRGDASLGFVTHDYEVTHR